MKNYLSYEDYFYIHKDVMAHLNPPEIMLAKIKIAVLVMYDNFFCHF